MQQVFWLLPNILDDYNVDPQTVFFLVEKIGTFLA
jgi:hypothetical protein